MTADAPFVDFRDRPVPLSTEPTDLGTLGPNGAEPALEFDRPPTRESNVLTAQEYFVTARGEVEQAEAEGSGAVRNYDSDFFEAVRLSTAQTKAWFSWR